MSSNLWVNLDVRYFPLGYTVWCSKQKIWWNSSKQKIVPNGKYCFTFICFHKMSFHFSRIYSWYIFVVEREREKLFPLVRIHLGVVAQSRKSVINTFCKGTQMLDSLPAEISVSLSQKIITVIFTQSVVNFIV